VFKDAVAGLGLPGEVLGDGVTMVSELAANTLHAHDNVELDGAGSFPLPGAPEIWLYLRRAAGRWELTCKVFDSVSSWHRDRVPVPGSLTPFPGSGGPMADGGRGLRVVAALSGGRWGHHLSRSRLGGWKVPGKAVWFSLPVPAASVPGCLRRGQLAPCRAAWALQAMLTDRGLGPSLVQAEKPSEAMSVLSIRLGLTVWCRARVIWWEAGDGHYEQRVPTDLIDTAEKIVCTCQEMDSAVRGAP
jgi:hypothetical protein